MTVVREPEWLAARRSRAAELASTLELPAFKGTPGWEFTSLAKYDRSAFAPAQAGEGDAGAVDRVQTLLETPDAVEDGPVVLPLSQAVERHPELVEPHLGTIVAGDQDLFTASNDAEWTGGAFVYVPRGVRVDAPILLTAIADAAGTALHRRTLIVLEDGAEAEVWEQFLSGSEDGEAMLNTVVELVVGPNAKVTGAYAPHARQHLDFDTTQEHGAANTTSDLAFRGILSDRSTAVWRGMIKVDPGAQQTDAFQECRNLLLSKRAHADAIPGLEILANDVRCTHAAAIAQIDPEQVFYLRARGLPDPTAKRLVIEGFMAELVERFEEGAIREAMGAALERRLQVLLG